MSEPVQVTDDHLSVASEAEMLLKSEVRKTADALNLLIDEARKAQQQAEQERDEAHAIIARWGLNCAAEVIAAGKHVRRHGADRPQASEVTT